MGCPSRSSARPCSGPSQSLSREVGPFHGPTRSMKCGVQCSRGGRDDRSERAPLLHKRVACWILLSANPRRYQRQRCSALTGDALTSRFAARRGEQPGVLIGRDLDSLLLGEIGLLTGIGRAFGNALGLARGSSRPLRSGHGVQVAVAHPLSRGAPQGCSRVRREIPSGRTGRIALSSECSYRFVDCMFRVMASRPSPSGRGARHARR